MAENNLSFRYIIFSVSSNVKRTLVKLPLQQWNLPLKIKI